MARPTRVFEPSVTPENPTLTAVLVNYLLNEVQAGKTAEAIETLRLVDDAAGPEYTRQLMDYLVGLGLEALLPA